MLGLGTAIGVGVVLPRRYWENAMMTRSCRSCQHLRPEALLLPGQQVSFGEKIYPILENAGCRNCHNVEGVASATRLHFPIEGADQSAG